MKIKEVLCCSILLTFFSSAGIEAGNDYNLTVESGEVAPGGDIDISVFVDSSSGGDIQGWSWGICSDPAALTLNDAVVGSEASALNGGDGPDFNEMATFADGYTVGVVICFTGCEVLDPGIAELSRGSYTNNMPDGSSTTLNSCDTLGNPQVATVVVVGGASIPPVSNAGTVTSYVPPIASHIRGDSNNDGKVNIADGIHILTSLFQGGPAAACESAMDVTDDGSLDPADAIFVFNYRFLDGPAPSAPFPDCGVVSGQTLEDCLSHSSCP